MPISLPILSISSYMLRLVLHLSTWGLWRVERCVLMPNADFLTTFKQHQYPCCGGRRGVPRCQPNQRKSGARMWSKNKMGRSPIIVHLQKHPCCTLLHQIHKIQVLRIGLGKGWQCKIHLNKKEKYGVFSSKSYQFEQRWMIKYAFCILLLCQVALHFYAWLISFAIRLITIQFCIPYRAKPFMLLFHQWIRGIQRCLLST